MTERSEPALESLLGRTSPVIKLGLALAWLVGLAATPAIWPPLVLTVVAVLAGTALGGLTPGQLGRAIGPLLVAAVSLGLTNLVFSASNTDPVATQVARLGPLRITSEAATAAAALTARVLAIVTVGGVFAQTTDPTRLVDSLVAQLRVSPRFAYGALAAYQAVPRLGDDLVTLRQARRVRGLGGGWHPRLLVGLLVRAIRHADQLAIAMDARAFGLPGRTSYRPVAWHVRDLVIGVGGVAVLVLALALG
ncbi:MAG: energy-coupling factor transporter transmembrane protein EcfT [Chloroflexi bacterium]|nr:energy-coupling factor transporter transmembrane protein EcfT [Chloroflexota bacterium]